MTCERRTIDLSAHLDGALSTAERAALDEHLTCCPVCRQSLASLRVAKHAVGRLPSREEPPGAVRARVEALRFSPHRLRRRRLVGAALAGGVALAASVLAIVALPRDGGVSSELADLLVADHLKSVPEVKPVDVASSDPKVVARFFAGRTPFAAVVPTLPGATLIGGRLCKIAGRPVELLFYRASNETVSLFVADSPFAASECRSARDHTVCGRTHGAYTLHLVGKLPRTEIRALLDGITL